MRDDLNRRDLLRVAGVGLTGLTLPEFASAQEGPARRGVVAGHPEGGRAGQEILAAGGNAVDAIVAAALVAGVVSPHMCGPGGYGGHAVIARADGRPAIAIDFNSAAPRA